MSVNSTSSNSSFPDEECLSSPRNLSVFTAILIAYVLLIPLFVFVLYVGHQRWQKRRHVSAASHSDVLRFNMVALELINVLGYCFFYVGVYTDHYSLTYMGFHIFIIVLPGQTLFHVLACMERYLAVVHPVTYLGLKQAATIRNVTIGCVWIICFVSLGVKKVAKGSLTNIHDAVFIVASVAVLCFCSVSVVCVLTRPGPGNRVRVDPMKQKAFYTVVLVTGALLLKFLGNLVCTLIMGSSNLLGVDGCFVWSFIFWLGLPCSLVIPLLFLHRAGKLPCGFCPSK